MGENKYNSQRRKQDLLFKAIRELGKEIDPTFRRPSEDTITAYLLGAADQSQQDEVRSAMEKSAAFRREMLSMVRELQRLPMRTQRTTSASFFVRHVADYFTPTRLVPIAAVAAIIALVTLRNLYQPSPVITPMDSTSHSGRHQEQTYARLEIVNERVDPGLLFRSVNRSIASESKPVNMRFEDSVALAALSELLVFDDDTYIYHVKRSPVSPLPQPGTHQGVVQLVDSAQNIIGAFVAAIPRPSQDTTSLINVWFLGLSDGPQYQLLRTTLSSDTVRVLWPLSLGQEGAVIFTYWDGRHYQGISGYTFTY